MELSLKKQSLNRCLGIIEKALPSHSTIPIIENILMESDGVQLVFTSTNLEVEIKVVIPMESGETGKILLPGKIIDIANHLPGPDVNLAINMESYRVDMSSGAAAYNLFGADPADYPDVPIGAPAEEEKLLKIEQSIFKQFLKKVIFAASSEETRPAFNGVLFSFKENNITLTASDTYRLVVSDLYDHRWSFNDQKFLIPAKSLRELLKILDEETGEMAIYPYHKKVVFATQNEYFAARVLEEKYPDVSGVITNTYKTRVTVERKTLEQTVARAALLAEGVNQAVQFLVANGELVIKVFSQVGRMVEPVKVMQEGEEIDIYINSRFVLDILKVLDQDQVIIDFNGKNGPVLFRIINDDNYLYLVLPIKME